MKDPTDTHNNSADPHEKERPSAANHDGDHTQSARHAADTERPRLAEQIMDRIPDQIFAKDTSGRFVYANRAVLKRFGLHEVEEIIGKQDSDFFEESRAEAYRQEEEQILETGIPLHNSEVGMADQTGEERWRLSLKVPWHDVQGRLRGIVGINRDITDRKSAEHALEQLVHERTAHLEVANQQLEAEIKRRKEAEKKLEESERRHRAITELTHSYCYTFDITESGELIPIWLWGKLPEILGCEESQLQDLDGWEKQIHPEDYEGMKLRNGVLLEGRSDILEFRIIRADGEIRWIRDYVQPERDPETGRIHRFHGAGLDITEQRNADESLRESRDLLEQRVAQRTAELMQTNERLHTEVQERSKAEHNLRMLLASSEDVILVNDRHGRYLYYEGSPRYEITPEEVVGKDISAFFDAETTACIVARIVKVFETGEAVSAETEMHWRGETIYFSDISSPIRDKDGTIVSVLTVSRNITDRKLAEKALRESEERFRRQYQSIPVPTYSWQRRGDTFVLLNFNDQARKITEGKISGFVGWTVEDLYAKRPDIVEDFRTCYRTKTTVRREMPYRFRTTGQDRILAVTYVYVNQDLLMVHTEDITARREAEEELRKHQAEFAHIGRVNLLGEMASNLAHELNQPLGAIANYAEASLNEVRKKKTDQQRLAADLEHVASQATRAGDIIRRIREFVRKEELVREEVNVNQTVMEAIALEEFELKKKGVRTELRLAEQLPNIELDRIQIEQVILNLVLNASEAMEQTPVEDRLITIETSSDDNGRVLVSVTDSGQGISPEIRDTLFNPFVTTKPNGLGLGLSISKSIIENHHGELHAAPNATGGMTFRFSLQPPATRDQT